MQQDSALIRGHSIGMDKRGYIHITEGAYLLFRAELRLLNLLFRAKIAMSNLLFRDIIQLWHHMSVCYKQEEFLEYVKKKNLC